MTDGTPRARPRKVAVASPFSARRMSTSTSNDSFSRGSAAGTSLHKAAASTGSAPRAASRAMRSGTRQRAPRSSAGMASNGIHGRDGSRKTRPSPRATTTSG
ncbi:MAG: hypothetical protein U1F43_09835 [Myxococcota bacterium]